MSNWECSVCGYIHKEGGAPEKCPACASLQQEEGKTSGAERGEEEKKMAKPVKTGSGAPEKMSVREWDPEPTEAEKAAAAAAMAAAEPQPTFLDKIGGLVLNLHLHPFFVHFPSGILPAALVFLGIAFYLKIPVMEKVAYCNFVAVLVTLPFVILTGYMEWQKRYNGVGRAAFIIKIICSIIVLLGTGVLVFWPLIALETLAAGSPNQLIYLGVGGGVVVAAGISGYLGGKFVFQRRRQEGSLAE